jgi:1,4-dihydroxy-2-naphthoate octaprenyltransferase
MSKTLRLITRASRPEFLPVSMASLFLGFSWAVSPSVDFTLNLATLGGLCLLSVSLGSAFVAQLNTLGDYSLDQTDKRKKHLVEAIDELGRRRIKLFLSIEFLLSMITVYILYQIENKVVLLILWMAGIVSAYAYSIPPIRLKKRSWLAMISVMLILSIIPLLFVFYTFASTLNLVFLVLLTGQALTVYGMIIPTEIRDFFSDKQMGITTVTVRIGLVKASLLGMSMVSVGGMLSGAAFFFVLFYGSYPNLNIFLLFTVAAYAYVLRKHKRLCSLSKRYVSTKKNSLANEITDLAAHNPKWIAVVTQSFVLMSIVLLVDKFLL